MIPLGQVILGTVMLYMNRLDEAERYAREALVLDAGTQDAYLLLAAVHGEKNDYAAEVRDLDDFLHLEPKSPRTNSVRDIRSAAEGLATHLAQKR